MIGYPSGQDGVILPALDYLLCPWRKKCSFFLTKLVPTLMKLSQTFGLGLHFRNKLEKLYHSLVLNRSALSFQSTLQHYFPHPEGEFSYSVWSNIIDSPATGPPAAAENEYTKLLMQKAAVVLLLSTTVSKIKHWVVMKMPSLNP